MIQARIGIAAPCNPAAVITFASRALSGPSMATVFWTSRMLLSVSTSRRITGRIALQ